MADFYERARQLHIAAWNIRAATEAVIEESLALNQTIMRRRRLELLEQNRAAIEQTRAVLDADDEHYKRMTAK